MSHYSLFHGTIFGRLAFFKMKERESERTRCEQSEQLMQAAFGFVNDK